MGLKIDIHIETPLSKSEAEDLMAMSMMAVTMANGAIADLDPNGLEAACAAVDPKAPPTEVSICTYTKGHDGRHRYINFGRPQS